VISNFSSNGIWVATAADVRISDSVVRGNGGGMFIDAGARADVFRTKVNGNSSAGVFVHSSAAVTTKATISDSEAVNNSWGFFAYSNTTGTAEMVVSRSTASNNAVAGVVSQQESGTVTMWVNGSTLSGNGTGISNVSGTVFSLGNNAVRGNTTDIVGTVTAVPPT
jgi:hypothetical protein